MVTPPQFPAFKPIELSDREPIHQALWAYQPQTSECTFTNLFIWRAHYRFQWCVHQDWLLLLGEHERGQTFAMSPIGPAPRTEVTRTLLSWMRRDKGIAEPRIERADQRLITELEGAPDLAIEPTREHFDYVYARENLVQLSGRKYHSKRNHINRFRRSYEFTYAPLAETWIDACLGLTESWCEWRRCEEDMNLLDEWEAVREALAHFRPLQIQGGVILIDGQVQAFALGEWLNQETAVVHIEKANSEIPGLYAVINQQFCEHNWEEATYINREQDLGQEGLRKAKLSYRPDHMVSKYEVRFTGGSE